jgi:hypothetical protein
MAGRDQKFEDPEEAALLEQSRLLIAELDNLIARAKTITREHRSIREKLRERKKQEKR